jgi:sulfonate transport system substrate-binding protein
VWAKSHPDEVAALMVKATGVDLAVQRRVAERQDYDVTAITPQIITDQQVLADRLAKSGLAPKTVNIAGAVWSGAKS